MLVKELSKWMNVEPTLIKERAGLFMEGFLWVHGFRISVHPGEEGIQEKREKRRKCGPSITSEVGPGELFLPARPHLLKLLLPPQKTLLTEHRTF